MITITNAQMYSMKKCTEFAYEITYSDGTTVRAVVLQNGCIRKEYKKGDVWKLSGMPYVVKSVKSRGAERIVEACKEFVNK